MQVRATSLPGITSVVVVAANYNLKKNNPEEITQVFANTYKKKNCSIQEHAK